MVLVKAISSKKINAPRSPAQVGSLQSSHKLRGMPSLSRFQLA